VYSHPKGFYIGKPGIEDSMVQYLEGILKVGNLVLAVVAGFIALSLIKATKKRNELKPWIFLIWALVFFAVQMILGALRAFQIFESAFLTHVNPAIILILLIVALILQIQQGVSK
jgi:heme A synthase|tara:strand:+ start:247 stop:591 length:345 start_codon:yes stop_codon:yes gene_type:complete